MNSLLETPSSIIVKKTMKATELFPGRLVLTNSDLQVKL